ncbi:sialic acid-binding Ig-like lectin 14 [Arapaima gigas]
MVVGDSLWLGVWTVLILPGVVPSEWNVRLPGGTIYASTGSAVVIPCSFTYPDSPRYTVLSVMWCLNQGRCITPRYVYHNKGIFPEPAFLGRVRYLGDMKGNCTLSITDLRPSDSGTYVFRFITDDPVEKLPEQAGVALCVSGKTGTTQHVPESRRSVVGLLGISLAVLVALFGTIYCYRKR